MSFCLYGGGDLVIKLCLTFSNPLDCSPQATLSMGFPRQEYWSRLPFLSPGILPNPGIEPRSPALRVILYQLNHQESPSFCLYPVPIFLLQFFLICMCLIMVWNKKNYVYNQTSLRIIMNWSLWPRLMGNFQRRALNTHSLESGEAWLVGLATSQMLQGDIILVYLPGFKPTSLVVSTLRK